MYMYIYIHTYSSASFCVHQPYHPHVFSRLEVPMINGVYTCLRLKSRRAHDLLSVSARKKDFIKQQTHIFELTWNWHLDEPSLYIIIYIHMYAPCNNIKCGQGGVGPGSRVAGVSGVGMDHNGSPQAGGEVLCSRKAGLILQLACERSTKELKTPVHRTSRVVRSSGGDVQESRNAGMKDVLGSFFIQNFSNLKSKGWKRLRFRFIVPTLRSYSAILQCESMPFKGEQGHLGASWATQQSTNLFSKRSWPPSTSTTLSCVIEADRKLKTCNACRLCRPPRFKSENNTSDQLTHHKLVGNLPKFSLDWGCDHFTQAAHHPWNVQTLMPYRNTWGASFLKNRFNI